MTNSEQELISGIILKALSTEWIDYDSRYAYCTEPEILALDKAFV